MSFLGISSILYSIQNNTEGTKINDFSGLQKYIESLGYPSTWICTYDIVETLSYPHKTWKYLTGISSYEIKNDCCRLDRVGYEYSRDDFINMLGMISSFTEPFYFYNSPCDGVFQNAIDIVGNDDRYIYKIVCMKGIIEVYKITFKSETKAIYSNGDKQQ